MRLFEVSTNFESLACTKKYSYVYGYASRVDGGALVALILKGGNSTSTDATYVKTALVDEGVFAELQKIVEKYNFIKNNGNSHLINGLPQNFGGSMDIRYSTGDTISFCDNQSPIMGPDAGAEIADVISRYMTEKSIKPLDSKDIVSVRYREDNDGGYSDYLLEGNRLISESKFSFGDGKIFKNEKVVPADSLEKIRKMVDAGMLLNWKGLMEIPNPVFPNKKQQVIFTMKDGSRHSINSGMKGPGPANNSAFDIQMYLQNTLGQ